MQTKVRLLTLTPQFLLCLGLGSVIVMLMQDQNNENNGHLMNNVSRAGTWCGYSVIYGVRTPRGQQRIGWKHFWVNIHSICKQMESLLIIKLYWLTYFCNWHDNSWYANSPGMWWVALYNYLHTIFAQHSLCWEHRKQVRVSRGTGLILHTFRNKSAVRGRGLFVMSVSLAVM